MFILYFLISYPFLLFFDYQISDSDSQATWKVLVFFHPYLCVHMCSVMLFADVCNNSIWFTWDWWSLYQSNLRTMFLVLLVFYVLNFQFWWRMTQRGNTSWILSALKKKHNNSFFLQDIHYRILTDMSVQTCYILPGVFIVAY